MQPTPAKLYERKRQIGFEPLALRDILTIAFYYRGVGLTVALLVLALGAVVTVLLPPSYTSRARLLILDAAVYELQAGAGGGAHGGVDQGGAAVNVELQLLASSELHRGIVRRELGPSASAAQIDIAVRKFESHLNVSKLESSNVIEIVYRDPDPDKAAQQVRNLLTAYFDERANVLASGSVGFLTGERDKAIAQLNQANSEIAAYERENGVVDVTGQVQGAIALGDQLHQQLAATDASLAESRSAFKILSADSRGIPRTVELFSDNTEAAHTIGTMQTSLFELEKRRADLAARYLPSSPFVQQIDAQIASLKAAIATQKNNATVARRTGYNTNYDTVHDDLARAQANLAGISARHSVLQQQVAASDERLKSLIAISDTLSRLHMERDLLADNVKSFSSQLEQANVQQNRASSSGSTNVRVIEEPVPSDRRSNPRVLMVAASLFSAILISAAVVLVLSTLRETFLSPQEAERSLKLPVFCDLPLKALDGGPPRRDFGRLVSTLRSLRSPGSAVVCFLLCTTGEDDLATVAEGLASILARRSPGRVALVCLKDAQEAPAPGSLGTIRWENAAGLAIATVDDSHGPLDYVVAELRATYDYVVVTAPPLSNSFANVEFSPLADLVLLLVKTEETRKPVVEAVLARVSDTGTEVSGLVMTGRRYWIPAWIYRLVLNERLSY